MNLSTDGGDPPAQSTVGGTGTGTGTGTAAAWKIALIYAVISASWIFGSDLLLKFLLPQATIDRLTTIQTLKGLFYILITAALIFFLIRDAMKRIQASQHALQQSEERFRRMVEWVPIGVFVAVDARFIFVNRAMQTLLGADTPEQLVGRPVLDFIHTDYHAAVKRRMITVREQRIGVPPMEQRYRRLDGSYVWVEVAAIPLEYDGSKAAQVMVRNIEAEKRASITQVTVSPATDSAGRIV